MAITYGLNAGIFGIQEMKPLRGFPDGRVKIVMRGNDFVTAFVKTASGIRKFYVKKVDDHFEPHWEIMANYREETK